MNELITSATAAGLPLAKAFSIIAAVPASFDNGKIPMRSTLRPYFAITLLSCSAAAYEIADGGTVDAWHFQPACE